MQLGPKTKKVFKIISISFGILILVALILFWIGKPQQNLKWGVTFSTIRAEELGFNSQELFTEILNDLHPKKVRIPVYWSEIEPQQGQFNFTPYENLLAKANEMGTEVVLVLGKKQPRWPECHQPDWYNHLPDEASQDLAVLNMIEKSVTHFKSNQSIVAWQIENEPYFQYGPRCPVTSKELYEKEVALVAKLDNRPTIATDSGEKGIWVTVANSGTTILGTTMYREVYHDKKGKYLSYNLPWWTYNIKAGLVKLLTSTKEVVGMELQAEPWLIISNPNATPPKDQLKHMNPEIFQSNIEYATKVGLAENYLWGVEWWYWMSKVHGDNSMVTTAKNLFNK